MKALVYHVTPARWMLCKAAGWFSNRAFYGALSPLRLLDWPVPELPGPQWVRLRTRLGGICGTDMALIAQRNHPATILQCFASFPAVLGHENVATIDTMGADVRGWTTGRRVCVEPAIGCVGRGVDPPCALCAVGLSSLCESVDGLDLPPRAIMGLNRRTSGSWAEYFVAHQSQLHAVPDGVSDDAAVLVDPLASSAHAVLRRRPRPGESILVNGSGIVALGVIAAIRALGHDNRITAVVRHPFQAELARKMGAGEVQVAPKRAGQRVRYDAVARLIGGRRLAARFGNQAFVGGFDLTFDCTGTGRGITDAMKWTRSRGTVVSVGTSGITLVDTTPIWFDELEILGANGRQIENVDGRAIHTYDLILDWLQSRRLDLSGIAVARYQLSDYANAFADLLTRGRRSIVKAVFEPVGAKSL